MESALVCDALLTTALIRRIRFTRRGFCFAGRLTAHDYSRFLKKTGTNVRGGSLVFVFGG